MISVCEGVNKWGSLQLGRSSVLAESYGDTEWDKTSIEMYHKVWADKEMACFCKFQLFRTWFAGLVQSLCRSRGTWMQENKRFPVGFVCISHSEALARQQIYTLTMEGWLLNSCDSAPHPSWWWVTIHSYTPQEQQHSVKNCEFSEVNSRASTALSSGKAVQWKGKDGTL